MREMQMMTKRPMNGYRQRRVRGGYAVFAMAALLLVSGTSCGDDTGTTAKGSAERSTTTTAAIPSTAELDSALLTTADLPPGWTAEPATTTTAPESSADSPTDFLCPTAAEPLRQEEHDSVEASFSQSENGPFLYQALIAAPDAEAHMADVETVFASCVGETWTADIDGEPLDMNMVETSAPTAGSESAAYRITGTATNAPLTLSIDFVLIRSGSVIQLYGVIGIQSPLVPTTQLTVQQIAELVDTGDQKVAKVLAEQAQPIGTTVSEETAAHWRSHPDQVKEACFVFPGTFAHAPGEDPESGEEIHLSRENLDRNLASMSAESQQAYVDRMSEEAGTRGIPKGARTWDWQDQVEFLTWVFDRCVEQGLVEPSG